MREQLRQTLDQLREYVEKNLDVIRKNEANVRQILEKDPVSEQRSARLQEKFNANKQLLEENNDTINLQLSIIKYLEKYKKKEKESIEITVLQGPDEHVDYFELTINGEIEYNEQHPHYGDREFYSKLMQYYIGMEDYENCDRLYKHNK